MNQVCPICKKQTAVEFRPFCSKRCADIDLAHWLRGDYRIEGEEEEEEKQKAPQEEEVE
jgi:endogenous inhibitor of DNA gyrase (YacG/DUF329 family)